MDVVFWYLQLDERIGENFIHLLCAACKFVPSIASVKIHLKMQYLDGLDLTIFIGMLIVSALIGVYFAYFAKEKQNTTSEYLVGGRTMGVFPVSMSLIARYANYTKHVCIHPTRREKSVNFFFLIRSYISGISILGLPAEMYVYGTQYSMITVSESFVSVTMAFVYLPVFYKLKIMSSYEVSTETNTFRFCSIANRFYLVVVAVFESKIWHVRKITRIVYILLENGSYERTTQI